MTRQRSLQVLGPGAMQVQLRRLAAVLAALVALVTPAVLPFSPPHSSAYLFPETAALTRSATNRRPRPALPLASVTLRANPLPLHRARPPEHEIFSRPLKTRNDPTLWANVWLLLLSSAACLLVGRASLDSCPNGSMPCMFLLRPVFPSCKSPLTYCRVTLRTSKQANLGDCDCHK